MESPRAKLLRLSRCLYRIAEDVFGSLIILSEEQLKGMIAPTETSRELYEYKQAMEQCLGATLRLFSEIQQDNECKDYIRGLGSDAVWRFVKLGELLGPKMWIDFYFLSSPARFQKEQQQETTRITETIQAFINHSEWLELFCQEPEPDGSNQVLAESSTEPVLSEQPESDVSNQGDIEEVKETLKGQKFKLFNQLSQICPTKNKPGRWTGFNALKTLGIVDSDDPETVKTAIKRLKKELAVTQYFDIEIDQNRVRLVRLAPDK